MLKTAEDLLGPYVWGHYDLLVLPPSFPYGGMENPCLTFVTPTLLVGNQLTGNLVCHFQTIIFLYFFGHIFIGRVHISWMLMESTLPTEPRQIPGYEHYQNLYSPCLPWVL